MKTVTEVRNGLDVDLLRGANVHGSYPVFMTCKSWIYFKKVDKSWISFKKVDKSWIYFKKVRLTSRLLLTTFGDEVHNHSVDRLLNKRVQIQLDRYKCIEHLNQFKCNVLLYH